MSTFNSISKYGGDSEDQCGLDIKYRKSFPVPGENSSRGGYKSRHEDFGSTSSESTSAGSSVIPMSTSDSSLRGKSMLHQIPTVPFNPTYAYQMPRRYMQSVAGQVQQANVAHVPMGIPVGYSHVHGHRALRNMHSQSLQPQTIVYPMQQCQARTQDWARMPTSTTAVPFMMYPESYPTESLPEPQQVSSVASSAISTPVFSLGSPGYINSYGYVSTPVLSSAPCTPVPYQTAYVEVPPTLHLHKNNVGYKTPQGMSCNINMGPVSDGCRSAPKKPATTSVNSSNLPSKQPESLKRATATGAVEKGASEEGDEEEDDLWAGNVNYAEYRVNGSSNLFVTWPLTKAELVEKMQSYNLEVRDIFTTADDNIYNVIFVSHPIARKAFTMQQQIGLRIVPPKNSRRLWLRNPSPNFMVKFETRCRLVVRKGKAECHDVVGELLEGCLICADQLKGHRIRVVCCEGSFKFPGGKIVEMKGVPNNSDEKTSLGWISYRCKYTKESHVIRKSWNKLGDYVNKAK